MSCPFDEVVLLDYINGHLDAQSRAEIERSPGCLDAARTLRLEMEEMQPLLRGMLCPDVDTLVAYQQHELADAEQLRIGRHVERCRYCAEELQLLAVADETWLADVPEANPISEPRIEEASEHPLRKLMRTVREAFLIPPTLLPSPVLGEMWTYQTPQITIDLAPSLVDDEELSWTVGGAVRTTEGELFTEVERAVLVPLVGGEEIVATIEAPGEFVFKGLDAGKYRLQIITPTEEVFIREIEIGYGR